MYDENYLSIMIDRYKDIIKSGGENVSSLRIESVLAYHPKVERAVVIGVPDEKWGEKVVGIVIARKDQDVNEKELITFCRERLAGFETPKNIIFVDSFPETVGGKVLKYKLREQFRNLVQDKINI